MNLCTTIQLLWDLLATPFTVIALVTTAGIAYDEFGVRRHAVNT